MKRFLSALALLLYVALASVLAQEQKFVPASSDSMTLEHINAKKIEGLEKKFARWGDLSITGFIHGQWQWAEQKGAPAFGSGGPFNANSNNRFSVRRAYIKFEYTKGIFQMVVLPNFNDRGVFIQAVYLSLSSRSKVIKGSLGVFDRPFGYDIGYSSSVRESPERTRICMSLFPGESDVGAAVSLNGKSGWISQFTLDAGLFNGNGIGLETDSYKDFVGRLAWLKNYDTGNLGFAFSYYRGTVINPQLENDKATVYKYVRGDGFKGHDIKVGSPEKRQYFGLAGQFLKNWRAGSTHLRAEYMWGTQPGTMATNADPNGTSLGAGNEPLYLRNFMGGYAILVHDIGRSKHSIVLKYDYYDPNIEISGSEIGKLHNTGAADIAYSTYGIGYLFRMNKHIRLMAYYDMVDNEKSRNLTGYDNRIKQNIFTARIQVKF